MRNSVVKLPVARNGDAFQAVECENRKLKARVAELERLVVRDTLTPVFNRRHFMDELGRWCWRTRRYGGDYGLLFIDVDNLKAVNDRYGHLMGDAVLIKIANALMACVQQSDLVARMGGDEFAVLLDNIPADQISGKAASITQVVGQLGLSTGEGRLQPTISVGFTALEANVKPAELLLRADRSMYAAKQAKGTGPLR